MSFYSSFIKKTFFYSFLQILPALAGILILKFYSSLLTKEEFAVLAILTTVSNLSFIINSLCFDQVIARFYFDYFHDRKKLDDFLLSVIAVMCVLLAFLSLGSLLIPESLNNYLFKGSIENFRLQFLAAVLIGFGLSLSKSLLSFYRNDQSHLKVFYLTFIIFLLQIFFVWIGLKYMGNKVLGAQIGKFAGVFIPAIIFLSAYFFNRKSKIRLDLIKETIPFFMPLVLYSLMYWGVTQFDQVIFQLRLKNLELLAFYVMGFNIALFADLILNGLSSFMIPEMNLIMKIQSNKSQLSNYIHLYVLIGCFSLLLISFAGEFLVDFFLDDKYSSIGWIINGLLIGYIGRMLYSIFSFPVYYFKKTMILVYVLSFSLVLNLTGNWLLIPLLGIPALILSSILARLIQAFLTAYWAKKILIIPFNRFKIYGLTFTFGFLLLIMMLVDYFSLINYYLASLIMFVIALISSLLLFRKQLPILVDVLKHKIGFIRR